MARQNSQTCLRSWPTRKGPPRETLYLLWISVESRTISFRALFGPAIKHHIVPTQNRTAADEPSDSETRPQWLWPDTNGGGGPTPRNAPPSITTTTTTAGTDDITSQISISLSSSACRRRAHNTRKRIEICGPAATHITFARSIFCQPRDLADLTPMLCHPSLPCVTDHSSPSDFSGDIRTPDDTTRAPVTAQRRNFENLEAAAVPVAPRLVAGRLDFARAYSGHKGQQPTADGRAKQAGSGPAGHGGAPGLPGCQGGRQRTGDGDHSRNNIRLRDLIPTWVVLS